MVEASSEEAAEPPVAPVVEEGKICEDRIVSSHFFSVRLPFTPLTRV